jgi:hypothetical protein
MSSVFEIEHCPKVGIGIRFRDLVQRRLVLVDYLVDRTHDSSVLYRPAQIPTCFTAHDIALDLTRFDGRHGCRRVWVVSLGREELGDAKVALRRRGEKVVYAVLPSVRTL